MVLTRNKQQIMTFSTYWKKPVSVKNEKNHSFRPIYFLCMTVKSLRLCLTAHQAPLSMGFSGQEYWSGLPCPPPGFPNPGIEPTPLLFPASAGRLFTTSTPWGAPTYFLLDSKHSNKAILGKG